MFITLTKVECECLLHSPLQRLCAMIGSDDNGTCECQGCSCPTDYVAINRTCMPDVSMLLVCATCVCEWHVCFCIYVCVCVGGREEMEKR